MRSSPQCQEMKVLHSYRLAQLISGTSQATSSQAALEFNRQSWKRAIVCIRSGERVEDRKVYPFGTNNSCLKTCPFSKQWLGHFYLTKSCGLFGLGFCITGKELAKIWRTSHSRVRESILNSPPSPSPSSQPCPAFSGLLDAT